MKVIKTEDPETSGISICDNCGERKPGRPVEGKDTFTMTSRGWWFLCYDCFGPRVFWRASWNSTKVYESPAKQYV